MDKKEKHVGTRFNHRIKRLLGKMANESGLHESVLVRLAVCDLVENTLEGRRLVMRSAVKMKKLGYPCEVAEV